MDRSPLYLPEARKVADGKVGQHRRFQQPRKKNGLFKRKGIERWRRAVSTNLLKQNVLVPGEDSSSESDVAFDDSRQSPKRNLIKRAKVALGRLLPHGDRGQPPSAGLLPRIVQGLPSSKLFTKPRARKPQNARIQLDLVEAETEEIRQGDTLLRARRTTRRLSVASLPSGLPKVPYSAKKRAHFPALKKKKRGVESILRKSDFTVGELQMQVDDLIETVADKSRQLLAQRHAELQQCEFLGDEILQSSKQFQRVSTRTRRKYRLRNVCFPFTCCCS